VPKKEKKPFLKLIDNSGPKLVLVLLLSIYSAYSLFLALNLNWGVIPDEGYRFEVATYFDKTWGIPDDVPIAYTSGDNLQRNPYLGYWLYGRFINVLQLFNPSPTPWQTLVFLRIINFLFALGTVIFTYLISKQLIKNKWLQIFPVFLLTNTLMFVFLSGGVNYDNPTNLACAAGIFFLVRVLTHKDFLENSLGWMISIAAATLIKHSILPLALAMAVMWILYMIKNNPEIAKNFVDDKSKIIFLILAFLILISLNFSLYGVNLIRYGSLRPDCNDTFPQDVCDNSFFGRRHQEMALPEKLTLITAFRQGEPDPIRFTFDFWIPAMLDRIFGIMGEKIYFPIVVSYFQIALYWMIIISARYVRKPHFRELSLLGIFVFYSIILMIMNYNSELTYGFGTKVALQGRYLFPVISIAYGLLAFSLTKVSNKLIKYGTIVALVLLFLYGGPIRFIWYYNTVFADWFI